MIPERVMKIPCDELTATKLPCDEVTGTQKDHLKHGINQCQDQLKYARKDFG